MNRAEIRETLIRSAKKFREELCFYGDEERHLVDDLINTLRPANDKFDEFNETHYTNRLACYGKSKKQS